MCVTKTTFDIGEGSSSLSMWLILEILRKQFWKAIPKRINWRGKTNHDWVALSHGLGPYLDWSSTVKWTGSPPWLGGIVPWAVFPPLSWVALSHRLGSHLCLGWHCPMGNWLVHCWGIGMNPTMERWSSMALQGFYSYDSNYSKVMYSQISASWIFLHWNTWFPWVRLVALSAVLLL